MGKKYRDLVRAHSTARGSERSVLNVLADYANDDGEAYPSVDTIANDAGVSRRTAQRALQKLQDNGRVEVVAYPRGGHGRPTRYRILIPEKGDNLTPLNSVNLTKEQCQSDQRTVSNATKNSVNLTSLYIEEPEVEPNIEPESNRAGTHAQHRPPYRAASKQAETMQKVTALGMDKAVFRQITDLILEWTGRKEVADLDNDIGDRELYAAQECALSLAQISYRSPDAIEAMRERFEQVYHYFKTPPTYGQLVKFGSELRAGKHDPRKDERNNGARWQRSQESSPEPEPVVSAEDDAYYREFFKQRAAARAAEAS